MSKLNLGLLVLSLFLQQCLGQRTVETSVGSITGAETSDGYFQFLSIPYGTVDENNPFGASTPYPAFSAVFNANNEVRGCPQVNTATGTAVGILDCLVLNVYVPSSATATSKLPVIVMIHGGGFFLGSSAPSVYGPKYLVRHDVIVVTINYRLGPYGFMCLDTPNAPGNQGLKDQHLALEWVKNNIEPFGGNPDDVTLMGQSAGGHSIDFHLVSERDKLFNKVILQSASFMAATALFKSDEDAPFKIAERLGLTVSEDIDETLKLLASVAPERVVTAANELGIVFKPCVENKFNNVEAFITKDWIHEPMPKVENVPVLVGFNEHESLVSHINRGPEHFETMNIFYNYLNRTFEFNDERMERMEKYVRRFYIGDLPMSQETVWPIINFDSDYTYNHPIQRSIKKYLESNAKEIYYYMFSYNGQRNFGKLLGSVVADGAAHSDELGYLFDIQSLPATVSTQDQLMIDRMTTLWTNFAKHSDPTPQTTNLLPVKWVPLTKDTYNYLKIDAALSMERRPINRRMAFLELFYKLNDEYQRQMTITSTRQDEDDDEDSGANINTTSLATLLLVVALFIVNRH